MNNVHKLRKSLLKLKPMHDTPMGLIHPYWARKPMNVINTIISNLTSPLDLVADPFMGSGTTVFAALEQKRSIFASDINPLSYFLVNSLLEIGKNSDACLTGAEEFLKKYNEKARDWYRFKHGSTFIERERFKVEGDFENGDFELTLQEIVTKDFVENKWQNRQTLQLSNYKEQGDFHKYLYSPINFEALDLIENSRIAIPKGAKVSHFFTQKNIAAINCALDIINQPHTSKGVKAVEKLLLSSSLPLLRLSDKKASSQWPYWRPKKMLTSRNPTMIFQKRLAAVKKVAEWVSNRLPNFATVGISGLQKGKSLEPLACITQAPIQQLLKQFSRNEMFDLVITDPPYTDHAPYLEYSALWIKILGLTLPSKAFKQEIVKSDSPRRQADSKDYINRLGQSFDICCKLVKKDGYVVWFYQDWDLNHWSMLNKIALNNNMVVADIIPLLKQRRSMKTVTSPGATLDGDLICIFQKKDSLKVITRTNFGQLRKQLSRKLFKMRKQSLFDKYAYIIEFSLKNHCIDELSLMTAETKTALKMLSEDY